MLVSLADRRFYTPVEDGLGLVYSFILCQHLGVHLVSGYVIGILLQKRFELKIGSGQITLPEAIQSDAIPGEEHRWDFRREILPAFDGAFCFGRS